MLRCLSPAAFLLAGAFSAPALALEPPEPGAKIVAEPPAARFVACDNGLRCIKAPCPSRSAVNLDTGEITRGVGFDLRALTPEARASLEPSGLYYGTRILEARIENRVHGPRAEGGRQPPLLVVTAVFGPSTPAEAAQCRRGGGFAPPPAPPQ